jgi:hypothetical protein
MNLKPSNMDLCSVGRGGRKKKKDNSKNKQPNLENLQKLREEIDNRELALLV